MRKLITLIIILGLGGLAALSVLALTFVYSRPSVEPAPVVFEVQPGPFNKIAEDLEEQGVVTSAKKFAWLARLTGSLKRVKIGEYELNSSMLPHEVLEVLMSGKSKLHTITFPEGTNRFEMAEILESRKLANAATFLELTQDRQFVTELLGDSQVPSLEGYLFPETYAFTKFTGEKQIIRSMVEKFMAVYNEISRDRVLPEGFTRHSVVILASMVEKETGAPVERPQIASVFFNRLKIKMKLQSDPTTMYGILASTGKAIKNITREHLLTPTPYNTYTVLALPFGPIANPGRDALGSIFAPSTSDFLFFVSRNDGTHNFSRSLGEHNKAVRDFQLNSKAREGKSWRDLNKQKKKVTKGN